MKREVLRIHNLNIPYREGRRFDRVGLILFEGECTAFQGVSFSGKDDLLKLLTGRSPCYVPDLNLSVDGSPVRTQKERSALVYRLTPRGKTLRDWTVAEYIQLQEAGWLLLGSQKKTILKAAGDQLEALKIPLDAEKKLSSLSETEKRLTDLARACSLGARVLVMEDELEGLTEEEILSYASILREVARREHMAVIINAHSNLVVRAVADRFVIFRDGRIVKKCKKTEDLTMQEMESYVLGPLTTSRRILETQAPDKSRGREPEREPGSRQILYRMREFPSGGYTYRVLAGAGVSVTGKEHISFSLSGAGVTTFLVLNEAFKTRLFMNLSGRNMEAGVYCVIGEKRLDAGDYTEFVKNRVVSCMHLGSREELFGNMSIGENMVLPSLRKLSFVDYMTSSSKLSGALDQNGVIRESLDTMLRESDVNDRIAATMERWYIYRPKVLVLLEPFEHCDLFGSSIVRSYIRRMTANGACVILIKSRSEGAEDISDEVIQFL